jgi:GT2 family glycosyltransferase
MEKDIMKKKDLSIVIVTFNSEDTIVECIDSILATIKEHSFEIIVSDNSRNELTQMAVGKYKNNNKVVYMKNDDNFGFSKGNNLGIKKANGNYLLFLNPDTKMYEKTIDGMLEFMKQHPDCGASTCFVKLPNGQLDDSAHRGFPTPWNSFSHFSGLSKVFPKSRSLGGYNLTYLDTQQIHEIDSLAGSFMLVPFKVGEKLNWWDEDYFFYGEDIDFCYRIKKAGYKIYFVPEFSILHMKGISSGIKKVSKDVTKASSETKKIATYHRFRAMEIFYDKHYKKRYPSVVTALVMSGIRLKKLFS